ncbi:hypothetical protein [Mucilaginibacter dorajii]|uniref:Uncharacterized protein n=1 Tax=Mucilaginibacter dorajii TaxID=692994 RepID=A0ABP7P4C8_9SPHI|nr:hypothetical protein [Mucilaginibacter dorajii]MCS3734409.1 hypothetical protein [Mucilaginibacter dorajii]
MDPAQLYSFKVWLTMLIFAPLLQTSAGQIFFHQGDILSFEFIKSYPVSVGVLLVLSAPLGALLTFSITRLSRQTEALLLKQRVTIAIGVTTLLVFGGAIIPKAYTLLELSVMILPYTLSLLLGVWLCNLDLEQYNNEEEEELEESTPNQ